MALFRANRGTFGNNGVAPGRVSDKERGDTDKTVAGSEQGGLTQKDHVAELMVRLSAGLQSQAEQHQLFLSEWSSRLQMQMVQLQARLDRVLQLLGSIPLLSGPTQTPQPSSPPVQAPASPPAPPCNRPSNESRQLRVAFEVGSFPSFDSAAATPAADKKSQSLRGPYTDRREVERRDVRGRTEHSGSMRDLQQHLPQKTWALNEQMALRFAEDIDSAMNINTSKLCDAVRRCLVPQEHACEEALLGTEKVLAMVLTSLGKVSGSTGGSGEQPSGFNLLELPAAGGSASVDGGVVGTDTLPGQLAEAADARAAEQPASSIDPSSALGDGFATLLVADASLPGGHTMPLPVRLPGTACVEPEESATVGLDVVPDGKGTTSSQGYLADALPWLPLASGGSTMQRIFILFEDSPASILGRIIEMFLLIVIAISTVSFIMESMPEFQSVPHSCVHHRTVEDCEPVPDSYFYPIEAVCIAIFTAEYAIRLLTVHADPSFRKRCSWIRPPGLAATLVYMVQPLNVIDLLAVLPFYVDLAMAGESKGFRLLRLARTLRLFKVGKHHDGFRIVLDVLKMSGQPLAILAFFNMMVAIIFAALIYFVEGQEYSVDPKFITNNERTGHVLHSTGVYVRPTRELEGEEVTPFRSIPYAMWWVFVTMTTVGYGDISPTSRLGKAIGVMCFYVGIVFLALPISVITLNFEIVYEQYNARQSTYDPMKNVDALFDKAVRRLHSHPPDRILPQAENFRRLIFMLFDDPSASKLGRSISGVIIVTIMVSTSSFIMESMPQYSHTPSQCNALEPTVDDCRPVPDGIFHTLETVSIAIFTLDYCLRVSTVHTAKPEEIGLRSTQQLSPWRITMRYCLQWLNLIDFFAVLPFYVGLVFDFGGSTAVLRVLRLVRVFRVLKAPKLRTCVEMFQTVVADSLPALVMLFLLTALMAIFFASCIVYAEGSDFSVDYFQDDHPQGVYIRPTKEGYDVEVSPFRSILYSLWWFFATATTVGYGDDYPTTTLGRIIGVASFYIGITLVALKLTAIGASFGKFYPVWVRSVTEAAPGAADNHNAMQLKSSPRSLRAPIDRRAHPSKMTISCASAEGPSFGLSHA